MENRVVFVTVLLRIGIVGELWVSGIIKRQKGHFVRVERTIVAMVFGTDNMSFVGTWDRYLSYYCLPSVKGIVSYASGSISYTEPSVTPVTILSKPLSTAFTSCPFFFWPML
jgi:hypothetical protein